MRTLARRPRLPSPRGRGRLGSGQVDRGSPFADIDEIGHAHMENLRQLVKRSQGRVPAAAFKLLVVAVGDTGGGHVLLREAPKPSSALQVLPEPLEEDREIHSGIMAGAASLIEPTTVACLALLAARPGRYSRLLGERRPRLEEDR